MKVRFLLTLALCGVIAGGCGSQVQGKAETEEARPAVADKPVEEILIPVQAELPARDSISAYFETTARVVAENRVEVVAKGTGIAREVNIKEGDRINKGDVIARLDQEEFEAQIRQSRVSVQQAKYQMDKAQEQLQKGILSPFEAENARFAHEQAKATLELLEVQLKNQTITAPISGIVTMKLVQDGMMVAVGVPVCSIVDPDSYILPISPPEKELVRLKEGQEALVSIDSMPGEEFVATVRRINPSVDPLSGTVKVILDFPAETRTMLREAAFARVRLVMETRENVLVVPKDTLIEENAREYLMVIEKQAAPDAAPDAEPKLVAQRVEVKTGLEDSDNIEIVSGLDEGTMVITLGQHTLKAGSQVKLTNSEAEIAALADLSAEEALARSQKKQMDLTQGGGDRREKLLR